MKRLALVVCLAVMIAACGSDDSGHDVGEGQFICTPI